MGDYFDACTFCENRCLKRVQVNVDTEGYLPRGIIKTKKERNRDVMAEVLEVFRKHWMNGNQWAVHLVTKSHMVLNHLEIIAKMKNQVQLEITITTIDENKRKILEGFAPSVKRRLEIMRKFAEKGVIVRAMCMPHIGDKKDAEIIKMTCFRYGAKAFKHKSLNYWDEEEILNGRLKKVSGRQDSAYDELLENSSEPVLENGKPKKKIVKMPIIIKSGKSKRWKSYKREDLQDKEMVVENSGYDLINDIDWGYVI